jgi:hypothetical protein
VCLEDRLCHLGGCIGPPFVCSDVEATRRCHDVAGDANDGGSHGCVSSWYCKKHSIVDLCEEDLNGCGWVPLALHRVQLLVQFGFSDGVIGVMEVREECEAWCIVYAFDWIEYGANVDFGHSGLKLDA